MQPHLERDRQALLALTHSHLSPDSFGRLPDPEDWGIGVCGRPLLGWDPPYPK
jgi:hypothetical protein